MRSSLCVLIALATTGLSDVATPDAAADLGRRLADFRSPAPIAASVHLDLHLERVLHHRTVKGDASVPLDVEQDAAASRRASATRPPIGPPPSARRSRSWIPAA
jgi:hypothetical protein